MINLLPPKFQSDLHYARLNTRVSNYIFILMFVILGLSLLGAGGYFYIGQSINHYEAQVSSSREILKSQKIDQTKEKVETISGNIKLISQVLSKQVIFSKLIKQIGAVIPNGAVLDHIELSSEVSGAIDLSAFAENYDAATQVQVNLQDPKNKIFDKVDINSINCVSKTTTQDADSISAKYPCKIALKALFRKDNPFSFINNNGLSGPRTEAKK